MTKTNKKLIIVLTYNRPKILKRCIMLAIKYSNVATNANWFIIDDSCPKLTLENSEILNEFSKMGLCITHITKSIKMHIIDTILKTIPNIHHGNIFLKSSNRDISGLRNFGLILSIIMNPEITFFMDDDIISCNKNIMTQKCFFDHVSKKYKNKQNYIIGASLIGMLDESYIGRLDYLINQNDDSAFECDINSKKNNTNFHKIFWINKSVIPNKKPTHTSAGLIGFKLDSKSIIPFPSSYNEDWIWCILQSILYNTNIQKEKINAVHHPPSFFNPTQKGILWEQYGDYIFDFILEVLKHNNKLNLKEIYIKTIEKISMNEKIKELDEMVQIIENRIKENLTANKKNNLIYYKFQIEQIKEICKKTNMYEIIESWFNVLNNRHIAFTALIENPNLCNNIKKLINDV